MSKPVVIGTNIICRHALQDHDEHSPRTNRLFQRLARGEELVHCPHTAIFEAIHILHGRNEAPRPEVADYLRTILAYPGFETDSYTVITTALEIWTGKPKRDFADCYHLAITKELGMNQIYSFDRKMDRYPGIERIEPE